MTSFTKTGKDSKKLLVFLLLGTVLYTGLGLHAYMDDFRAFYLASQATLHQLDPYNNHDTLGSAYADPLWPWPDSRFIYPPMALFLFLPLSAVSYPAAKVMYAVLAALFMAAVLLLLRRRIAAHDWVWAMLFFTMPVYMSVATGQIEPLILLLLIATYFLGDRAAAGILWGAAVSIKVSPLLFALWLLGARRWKTLFVGVATIGALSLFAYLSWGQVYFVEFQQHLKQHAHWNALPVVAHVFSDLKVEAGRVYTPDHVYDYEPELFGWFQNPLRYLGSARLPIGLFLVIATASALFASRYGRRIGSLWGFCLFTAVTPLANPLLWPMSLVACLPMTAMLLSEKRHKVLFSFLLLPALFAPRMIIGDQNYAAWLVGAGICIAILSRTMRDTREEETAATMS